MLLLCAVFTQPTRVKRLDSKQTNTNMRIKHEALAQPSACLFVAGAEKMNFVLLTRKRRSGGCKCKTYTKLTISMTVGTCGGRFTAFRALGKKMAVDVGVGWKDAAPGRLAWDWAGLGPAESIVQFCTVLFPKTEL